MKSRYAETSAYRIRRGDVSCDVPGRPAREHFRRRCRPRKGAGEYSCNPHLTPLREDEPGVEIIDCHYPLIHRSNTGPWHFIHGFAHDLSERLGIRIETSVFKGDIHLSTKEKAWMSQVQEITREPVPFWIVVAGGKYDFTAKCWAPKRWQAARPPAVLPSPLRRLGRGSFRGAHSFCAGGGEGASSSAVARGARSAREDGPAAARAAGASRAGRALPGDAA